MPQSEQVIHLKQNELPLFVAALKERTIPWKSRFFPSKHIMLELSETQFRLRPNGGNSPPPTIKATIISEGSTALIRWARKGLDELKVCMGFWLGGVWTLGLTGLISRPDAWLSFLGALAFMSVMGTGIYFSIRHKITTDLDKMEELLASAAVEAATRAPAPSAQPNP
jgi:hypothetical protein